MQCHCMELHGLHCAALQCMESYYSTTSLGCMGLLVVGSYFLSSVKCLGGRAHYKIATIIIIIKLTKENHLILHKPMLTTIWLG